MATFGRPSRKQSMSVWDGKSCYNEKVDLIEFLYRERGLKQDCAKCDADVEGLPFSPSRGKAQLLQYG